MATLTDYDILTSFPILSENGDDIITSLPSPSKFPRYADTVSRIRSFEQQWIKRQPPEAMADAGFFFENIGDRVRCFHCGISLTSWGPQDDPWIEHAHWCPHCEYVIAMRGREFVTSVSKGLFDQQHQLEENDTAELSQTDEVLNQENPESSNGCKETEVYQDSTLKKNPLLTVAYQSVLEMGYLPCDIKKAVDHVLESKGWENLSGENILNILMEMEDRGIIKDSDSIRS